jgi:low affinity Fe/Cu permease
VKRRRLVGIAQWFEQFAHRATIWAGSYWAFVLAILVILLWAITGPLFNFSDTWQLVINTGTTIVTFIMVFLIQQSQNKEALVVQVKLNEIIAAMQGASNRLINIEDLTEAEVRHLHERYHKFAHKVQKCTDLTEAHSIEEALLRKAGQSAKKSPPSAANTPTTGAT